MNASFPKSFLATFLMAGLLLGGCASVTPRKIVGTPGEAPKKLPAQIYVRNFSAPDENLRVDREGQRLSEFKADLANKLSGSLAKQLNRSLAPAKVALTDKTPPRGNAWLITGRFDRVEQGSRALRALVGFGAGATKVVATADVYDLSGRKPALIMRIQTTGGSNATPGTVINLAPIAVVGPIGLGGVVAGGGVGALPGLGADVKRTAREITAVLSDYCYRRGLIFEKQAMNPKPVGRGQLRLSDPARPDVTQ